MKSKFVLVVLIVLSIFFVVGCNNQTESSPQEKNSTEENIVVKDHTGEQVIIPSPPKRIISLFPSHTEILFALGLEEEVIAVTKYDNYPVNVQEKVEYSFEDALNPNTEKILELNPDLVLLGAHNQELIKKLRDLSIPVLQFDAQNVESAYEVIEKIGAATTKEKEATTLIQEMKEKEAKIVQITSSLKEEEKVKVFVAVSSDLWTAGKNTFMDELITKAGGINIVQDTGWVQLNEELVIESNPQVIFTTFGYYDPTAVEGIKERQGWQGITAIQNNQVLELDNDLISRPGPRIIDGLESIAKALYPNKIK